MRCSSPRCTLHPLWSPFRPLFLLKPPQTCDPLARPPLPACRSTRGSHFNLWQALKDRAIFRQRLTVDQVEQLQKATMKPPPESRCISAFLAAKPSPFSRPGFERSRCLRRSQRRPSGVYSKSHAHRGRTFPERSRCPCFLTVPALAKKPLIKGLHFPCHRLAFQ